MPLIPVALALAQYAPSLLRYFGVGEKSAAVAETAIAIAKTVTGASSPTAALGMIKDNQGAQAEFREAVLARDAELETKYLADRKSARERDMMIRSTGSRNYRADAMLFLAVMVVVGLTVAIWHSPEIPEWIRGIFTLILGRFLGYLDNIYNFEFGSTRSSKQKDDTMNRMSRGDKNADSE